MNSVNSWAMVLATCIFAGVTGCALKPTWHWEKPGASDQEYSFDLNQCKTANYPDTSGMVTNEAVRRMFACMEAKGWSKVAN
jgi:hypothetical protein